MQEIHISMQEVKNYYAGRKGSLREVQHPANSADILLLMLCKYDSNMILICHISPYLIDWQI